MCGTTRRSSPTAIAEKQTLLDSETHLLSKPKAGTGTYFPACRSFFIFIWLPSMHQTSGSYLRYTAELMKAPIDASRHSDQRAAVVVQADFM